MGEYAIAMAVMDELFSKDCVFSLATVSGNKPSVRMIDTYYQDGAFFVVTYSESAKVKDLEANEHVALCHQAYRFDGKAHNIGHPLRPENAAIRQKLIQVFEPWYFMHNNEDDMGMCYVRIDLKHGFYYKDGTGYTVDFGEQTVETQPFVFDAVLPE